MSGESSYQQILHYLKLDSMYYSRSTLGGERWGIALPPFENTSMFHIVTSGRCFVLVNGESIRMETGDLVFISRACGHELKANPENEAEFLFDLPIKQISKHYDTIAINTEQAPQTNILCGIVRISHPAGERLIKEMPDIIHIGREEHVFSNVIGEIVRLVIREASGEFIGGETVITRLADVLLIQAIRTWVERDIDIKGSWLSAIRDEKIGKALSKMHSQPQVAWTVEMLGKEVGLSRTAFSNRFSQLVGDTVLNYLTHWRMNLAAMKIREGAKVDYALSESLGYQSESAFRRAFKKTMGYSVSEVNKVFRNDAV
ncbi:AraC family transcriptional regulator [Pleionea litopenaei]|uniref:AraC family transcriptional regulator n=1 Tax=Pleionea litopenaei TaxID=3070815 RepID=A0AA51RQ87_9GAMM|nr:AraC family transcriptional regulator [Pleionea sp. HL-JVS1]WMS85636.1 AraC family transcriptional regulator [Pleionea sp. HL-JVS1]